MLPFAAMFRTVPLPPHVPGALLLHSMPGCFEDYAEARLGIEAAGIAAVICLNEPDELEYESPQYAAHIDGGIEAWEQICFPIPDHSAPDDREAFLTLARGLADRLEQGDALLVHCYAGIGRTGTLACCVLLALGLSRSEALATVDTCGAGPEGSGQDELVRWVEQQLPVGQG